jgi:hypothetical protein
MNVGDKVLPVLDRANAYASARTAMHELVRLRLKSFAKPQAAAIA